jgi:L-aminopeptidase/D-esterase-like protein
MKNRPWKEIPITSIEGIRIGNAEYPGGSGCTVILADPAAVTGADIRGGGPASRESALLNPLAANDAVNAVLLTGGSAFGLSAADGVVKYLEERNIGFPTDYGPVPIVCASSIFDLPCGDRNVRADAALGYRACLNAGNFREGNYGAGIGATIGKAGGIETAMKSGIGAFAAEINGIQVGAIVAVNALGNIHDPDTGEIIAGMRSADGEFIDEEDLFLSMIQNRNVYSFEKNTTIGAIITNAAFSKTELTKIAGLAHNGFARTIRPVHTMFDGDSIYAMSTGRRKADINEIGIMASLVMSRAIVSGVRHAVSAFGLRGYDSL